MGTSQPIELPVLELEQVLAGSHVVFTQICDALTEHGAFVLRAPPGRSHVEEAFVSWRKFVDLPMDVKHQHHHSVSAGARHGGWLCMREAPVYMSHMDDRELQRNNPKQQFGCEVSLKKTIWPDSHVCHGFSDAVQDCARWLDDVSHHLMVAFALRLKQPADFLRYEPGYLTLSFYPAEDSHEAPSIGLHEHSDADVFTLLTQRTAALEIKSRDGHWFNVPALNGDDLLVLPGDWMELWTNGTIPAVRHRVRGVADQRVSLAFFQNVAKMDIGPLSNFTEPEASKYPTVPSDLDYNHGKSGVPRWKTAPTNTQTDSVDRDNTSVT